MAKAHVILSICDRCTKEVTTPFQRKKFARRDELELPKGWIHISANTATSTVFELDLCDECKSIVLDAAGRARLTKVS